MLADAEEASMNHALLGIASEAAGKVQLISFVICVVVGQREAPRKVENQYDSPPSFLDEIVGS